MIRSSSWHRAESRSIAAHSTRRSSSTMTCSSEPGPEAGSSSSASWSAVTDHAPDVCLLDLHFPGGTSLDALQAMRAGQPGTKVVVFSATADPQAVVGTLSLGASGFLRKSMSMDEICVMLDRAAEGQVAVEASLLQQAFLPPSVADPLWALRFL